MNKKIGMFIALVGIISHCTIVFGKTPTFKGKLIIDNIIIDLETGNERIVKLSKPGGYVGNALLSPDGKKLVYEFNPRIDEDLNELRFVDLETLENTLIVVGDKTFTFDWSPDSKFIVFKEIAFPKGIWVYQPETALGWPIEIKVGDFNGIGLLKWEKNGEDMVFSAQYVGEEKNNAYFRIRLGEKKFSKLFDFPPGNYMELLSPNNSLVAMINPIDWDLYIFDPKSGTRLVENTKDDEMIPFWSPDSKWVGAIWNRNVGRQMPYVVWNLETGKKKKITSKNFLSQPQWWYPQTETPVDCEKIIKERLGPGVLLTNNYFPKDNQLPKSKK